MSNTNTLRLNRRTVNSLKLKGKKWLQESIEEEKNSLKKRSEIEHGPFVLYIATMERALKEIIVSEQIP